MADKGKKKALESDAADNAYYRLREQGIIFIDREITPRYVAKVGRDLVFMHNLPVLAAKPFWIILNSPGGDLYQGLALHDIIKAQVAGGRTIKVVGTGLVASMSAVLLQAGSARLSLPNTQFLVHQVSEMKLFSEEEVNQAEENTQELRRINQIVMGIIAKRIGMPLAKLLQITKKRNYWLDPEGAMKFGSHGLIDKVITSLKF